MRKIILILFFAALIGTRFKVAPGVAWSDFFCVPLVLYVLMNLRQLSLKRNIVARVSVVYSIILLLSGLLNGTITNTVYLNFTRIFIEGVIVFLSLLLAIKDNKDIRLFFVLFVIYTVTFLIYSRDSVASSAEAYDNFQMLDIQGGRNGMAVTSLLITAMLTFFALFISIQHRKLVYILFPFLIFNIIFSASRFSVISLGLLGAVVFYLMRDKLSFKSIVFYVLAISALVYFVNIIMSGISSGVMDFSSELLENKLSENEDGGISYRINDLNIKVIAQWLESTPGYLLFFGDGRSITHGVFSFTFCCTGIIGFLYFVSTHIKMIVEFWKKDKIGKYISTVILLFFLNDIVTNSRFIIGVNNLLYMGILAFIYVYDRVNTESQQVRL